MLTESASPSSSLDNTTTGTSAAAAALCCGAGTGFDDAGAPDAEAADDTDAEAGADDGTAVVAGVVDCTGEETGVVDGIDVEAGVDDTGVDAGVEDGTGVGVGVNIGAVGLGGGLLGAGGICTVVDGGAPPEADAPPSCLTPLTAPWSVAFGSLIGLPSSSLGLCQRRPGMSPRTSVYRLVPSPAFFGYSEP